MADEDCVAVHPQFGVTCRMTGHPHRVAHYATGTSTPTTSWTLFWWDRLAVNVDPESKADQPVTNFAVDSAPGTGPASPGS